MKRKETSFRMKRNAKSLLIAICLALGLLAANVPAEARSTTGWDGFRGNGIDCVSESFGAVVNARCAPMSMAFEMVVDTPGWHSIGVWDSPGGYGSFQCQAFSFSGVNDGIYLGTRVTFAAVGQQSQNFTTYVYPGWAMSLYCYEVPEGRGIANVNWTP